MRSTSYPGAYLRRKRAQLGAPKATTAAAHKLARIIYHLLRHGAAYVKRNGDADATELRAKQEQNLHHRAKELGYELKKKEPPTADVIESSSA